jgi:geranylgeranyl diphosphate synthase type I
MSLLDDAFQRYLPQVEADLHAVLEPPGDMPPLFYHMLHYHMGWVEADGRPAKAGRGKRIRPVLCLLVSEAACGRGNPARPAAAAIELVHNFSLLHDDIQDRSPLRRGRPTVWSIWGEAQAINAGDALFALAHLALPRLTETPGARQGMMLQILGETCLELTRGQHLDISFESRNGVSTDEYLNMVTGKTAALIGAATYLGAMAAGADEARQAHFRAFGENLGMAFQVQDDVLDIWGDPEVTGKEAAVDIRQRKKTLPVLYALARSEELGKLYADPEPFDDSAVELAISLLDEVGAREYADSLAVEYSRQTLEHLAAAAPMGEAGQALHALVEMLLSREK